MKYFLPVLPLRQSIRPKKSKNLFGFVLLGSPPAHRLTGPTGKLRVLQVASPPMAVTSVVKATWQGHGKFFDQGKEPVQNVIPLIHTHLPLHWLSVVQSMPCKSQNLLVSLGVFLSTSFFVHCTVFNLFSTNPVN